jgi:hypothetical protein
MRWFIVRYDKRSSALGLVASILVNVAVCSGAGVQPALASASRPEDAVRAQARLSAGASVSPSMGMASFVTRRGRELVLDGRPFTFVGFNIYNANSLNNCWYALGDGSGLDTVLDSIGGAQNVFRAWFFQYLATRDGARDWTAFDHTLQVAARHGQRVIATLGDQWGDCERPDRSDFRDEAWYRSGYRATPDNPYTSKSYRDWVTEIVSRYRNEPTILAWQLMNEAEDPVARQGECSATAPATLRSWANDLASLVKRIDPNHLLSIGTMGGGQCGSAGEDYLALHSGLDIDLCEYHDYGGTDAPLPGDRWNGFLVRVEQAKALDKPLFVGETGITGLEAGGSAETRARLLDARFRAQFQTGVVGELVWAWQQDGSDGIHDFEVSPGDPLLLAMSKYLARVSR